MVSGELFTREYVVKGRKLDDNGKVIGLECADRNETHLFSVKEVALGILVHKHSYLIEGADGASSPVSVRLVTDMDGEESDNISNLPVVE